MIDIIPKERVENKFAFWGRGFSVSQGIKTEHSELFEDFYNAESTERIKPKCKFIVEAFLRTE